DDGMDRAAARAGRRAAGLRGAVGPAVARRGAAVNATVWLPVMVLASSFIPGMIIFMLPEQAVVLRTTLNLGGAILKIILLVLMMIGVFHGVTYEFRVPLVPGLDFV